MRHETITFSGFLTEEELIQQLAPVNYVLENSKSQLTLLIDSTALAGYQVAARTYLTQWNLRHRSRIRGVAVISDDTLWHMAIATMALATRQNMRSFYRRQDAADWLSRLGYPALSQQI